MRAVVFEEYGDADVVHVADVPEPHAGPGQIRIAVKAASVNPVDVKQRRGWLSGGQPAERTITGFDAAGVVDEVGDGVTGVSVGDEVFGVGQQTQAQYAVLTAWAAKPTDLGWSDAGALGSIGETAARGLTLLGVGPGTRLFVDGASGGVGKIAVQLAVARGAEVVGSGSASRQDRIAGLGATPVVYGDGVAERVRAIWDRGLHQVFDVAGKTPIEALIGLVATPADVLTIANFGAGESGVQVTGSHDDTDPFASLAEVADLYRAGRLSVEVDDVLPFSAAAEGQRVVEGGTRKVVLVP